MKKNILNFGLFFIILIACKKSKSTTELIKLQGGVFGTTYHITYQSDKNYQKQIDSLFTVVNKSLSTYLPTSDISRINNNDSTVVVDDLFFECFDKAKRIHKETDGYFEPTLTPIIDAYGFGSGTKKELTQKQTDSLMQFVDFNKVEIKNRKVYKAYSEIQFNVNAFAKGYGIDVIGRFFEFKGIQNYLVEIGGEIRTRGLKNGNPWKVAIEKPNTDGTQSFQKIIELTNKSMATSGNYRKFRIDANGNKFVHIINPKTGLAKESNLLSASVIADVDCADVDAYATAFMVMGFEKTKAFVENHKNLKVILMYLDEKDRILIFEN